MNSSKLLAQLVVGLVAVVVFVRGGPCEDDPCGAGEVCAELQTSGFGGFTGYTCMCEMTLEDTDGQEILSDFGVCHNTYEDGGGVLSTTDIDNGCADCVMPDSYGIPSCPDGYKNAGSSVTGARDDPDCCGIPTECSSTVNDESSVIPESETVYCCVEK